MRKKILVVDNHPVILNFMSTLLQKAGHEVLIAEDGLSALDILRSFVPQVVFIDLVMPNISGEKLCQIIRGTPKLKDAFIVILSAIAAEQEVDLAELGANACIAKGRMNRMKEHILSALELFDSTSDLPKEVMGLEGLYSREITKELLLVKRHFEAILRSMSEGIVEVNPEERIVYANPKAVSLVGIKEEHLLGSDFGGIFAEDHRPSIQVLLRRVLDQSERVCEETLVLLGARHVLLKIFPVVDRGTNAMVILDDISELKETQEQLIQSEKLAALGRFSSGIAHEIKNPLGIILGGIGFLEKTLATADEATKTALSKIKESTLRADTIIQGLLEFARPSDLRTERLKPQDMIKETLSLLEYRAPLRNIRITTQLPEEDLYIKVDKNKIQQVLFNLLLNAVESMPNGGQISISIGRATAPEYASHPPSCLIQIVDTGEGISEEDLQSIFEPFFTTKRDNKATGLGLSTSKMIMEKHKGDLLIDSQPGKGTEVKLLIPLA